MLVSLLAVQMGYAAEEPRINLLISQKVAERKRAEREVANSEEFQALIKNLDTKYDQEVEQQARVNKEKLEAFGAQLRAAGTPEEQMLVKLKALNNAQREEDKVFLAAQKKEKRREIEKLVAQNWPEYQKYDLDFKNY